MGKFAYVTLVMKNDSYIPGALIMGYSLRQVSSPDIDIVVMITNDVSKGGRYLLSKVFTVIDVPYIEFKSKNAIMNNPENELRYAPWIAASYTKWNILNLTQYDKVFLLDADTAALRNIDDVFDFDTPAGIFDTPYSDSHSKRGFHDFYSKIKFGDKIPHKNIFDALNYRGIGAWGTGILVTPSKKDYKDFIAMLTKYSNTSKGFGFRSFSGVDEQSITHFFWLKKRQWTNLPPNLNVIPWRLKIIQYGPEKIPGYCTKDKHKRTNSKRKGSKSRMIGSKRKGGRRLKKEKSYYGGGNARRKTKTLNKCNLITCQVPHVIHYFGHEKIWNTDPTKWLDYRPWWQMVYNLIHNNSAYSESDVNKFVKIFKVDHNKKMVEEGCFWCKFIDKDFHHRIIDVADNLSCPRIKLECERRSI